MSGKKNLNKLGIPLSDSDDDGSESDDDEEEIEGKNIYKYINHMPSWLNGICFINDFVDVWTDILAAYEKNVTLPY